MTVALPSPTPPLQSALCQIQDLPGIKLDLSCQWSAGLFLSSPFLIEQELAAQLASCWASRFYFPFAKHPLSSLTSLRSVSRVSSRLKIRKQTRLLSRTIQGGRVSSCPGLLNGGIQAQIQLSGADDKWPGRKAGWHSRQGLAKSEQSWF